MADTDWTGGYDPECFITDYDKDFVCPICTCVARHPVSLPPPCECVGRVFCFGCITQLREIRCPTCRKPFLLAGIEPNRFVRGKIEAMQMKCPYWEKGCTSNFTLGKEEKGLKNHKIKCLYEEIQCRDCKKNLLRKELKAHSDLECEMRFVTCEVCREKFHVTKIGAHTTGLLDCDNCTVCPWGCSEGKDEIPIRKTEMERHLQTCAMFPVTCHVCNIELARKELPVHTQTLMSDHFTHIALRLIVVEQENKKLVQENQSLREEVKKLGVEEKYKELKALIQTLQDKEEKLTEGLSKLERKQEKEKKKREKQEKKQARKEAQLKATWTLDSVMTSDKFSIAEDGFYATLAPETGVAEGWAIGGKELKIGRHAWRMTLLQYSNDDKSGWLAFGISGRVKFAATDTYATSSFWGWSDVNYEYRGGTQYRKKVEDIKIGDIFDSLLDLNKHEFTVIHLRTKTTLQIRKLPPSPPMDNSGDKRRKLIRSYTTAADAPDADSSAEVKLVAEDRPGWVPHFNIRAKQARIHVTPLPLRAFGNVELGSEQGLLEEEEEEEEEEGSRVESG